MAFQPSLSPRFVAYVRDYLLDRGVDPLGAFEACGIDYRHHEDHDQPIPVDRAACLFERAAELTDNPSMGLSMGREFHYENSSLLIAGMLAAPSVAEGLDLLDTYDRHIDTGISTGFCLHDDAPEFRADLLHEGGAAMAQLNEYLISFLVQTLTTATRQPVPLIEVTFQHPEPRDSSALRDFLGDRLCFGAQHNALRFEGWYLKERFLTSNTILFQVLRNVMDTYFGDGANSRGFVGTVCRYIMLDEHFLQADAATVAARLNISTRTLRRRLAEEGFTFQEARNLARERRARYLLANSRSSLTEIAFELGYSELSAFSRAFRNWVGESPQAYRESVRQLIY